MLDIGVACRLIQDIGAPWLFSLAGYCAGHWGTMAAQFGWLLCWTLGHHGCSVWLAIVRDIRAPWLFSLAGYCAGH